MGGISHRHTPPPPSARRIPYPPSAFGRWGIPLRAARGYGGGDAPSAFGGSPSAEPPPAGWGRFLDQGSEADGDSAGADGDMWGGEAVG